jgi:hypothetical protein
MRSERQPQTRRGNLEFADLVVYNQTTTATCRMCRTPDHRNNNTNLGSDIAEPLTVAKLLACHTGYY